MDDLTKQWNIHFILHNLDLKPPKNDEENERNRIRISNYNKENLKSMFPWSGKFKPEFNEYFNPKKKNFFSKLSEEKTKNSNELKNESKENGNLQNKAQISTKGKKKIKIIQGTVSETNRDSSNITKGEEEGEEEQEECDSDNEEKNLTGDNSKNSVKKKEKNFQCEICLKLFSYNFTLRRHRKEIHNVEIPTKTVIQPNKNNKYECLICGKEYLTKKYLNFHSKTKH